MRVPQGLIKHLADGHGVPTAAAVPLPTAEVGESGAPGEVDLQWIGMPHLDVPHAPAPAGAAASPAAHPPPHAQPQSAPSSPAAALPPFRTLAHSLFVACATQYVSSAALQGQTNQRPADLMAAIARDLYTDVVQPLVPGTRASVCLVANLDTGYE